MNPSPRDAFALAARMLLLVALASLLGACAGGGPKKRIFPPSASVQELRVLEDGRWELQLRLQNFSTVAMRFDRIDAELEIDGVSAAPIAHVIADTIPANSAEIIRIELQASEAAAQAVRSALETRRGLGYRLTGTLTTSEPGNRQDRFEFDSALTPMPGLDGVLR
ncbi:MAG: LEA type 2 family protein [Xanthomonadales bacterium]|nr:LEA type 2 family protein [Xanthomonadales bacterium]